VKKKMSKTSTSKVYAIRLKQDLVSKIDEYKAAKGYESDAEPLLKIIKKGLEAINKNE
jgi:metal-responsive CopG/Arc/MetJ family transcriptional regulator